MVAEPVVPGFERLRQEGHMFQASLDYKVNPYLKENKSLLS